MASGTRLPPHKADLTTVSAAWAPNQPATVTNTEPPSWHHSPWWSVSFQVCSFIRLDHFLHGRDIIIGIETYPEYRFTFSMCNASEKTIITYVQNASFTDILSTLKKEFSKRSVAVGLCSWDSLILPSFPSSPSRWFDRRVEWPFEVPRLTLLASFKDINNLRAKIQRSFLAHLYNNFCLSLQPAGLPYRC